MIRFTTLSFTLLGFGSMVLGQSIEVVLFQETGLEEATQTALSNYAAETGVAMTFYEEVLDYSASLGSTQPCAVMDSILSQKDVAIFLGGTKPQHCNWADIVPQLYEFVEGGGTLIFQGPNADGGMAFFFEPEQWEQFDESPWFGDIDDSQHWCCGLGVENANCGGGEELFGVSHTDHPIFSGAYNYPYGQQGVCDMMIFEPSWYTLDAADLNDPRFFSILEFGQALNTDWVHEGEDTQMIFGKSVGAGHVVFYGENNPLPDPYTGSQTLLGNILVHLSGESGCTNENACNYDSAANFDDGSCLSAEQCVDLQTPPYVPSMGLVGWFPLAEGAISSQVGEELVELDGATPTADRFGNLNQAQSFNGQDDVVSVKSLSDAYNFGGQNQISISTWVNPMDREAQYGLVSFSTESDANPQYALKIESTGHMYFIAGASLFEQNGFNLSTSTLDLEEWNHMVMTYDGMLVKFYLNGILEFENPVEDSFPSIAGDAKLFFGKAWGANNMSLHGSMDDTGIWNRPLSYAEVAALYLSATPVFGCLDTEACNFSLEATLDDGSCHFLCEYCLEGTVWSEEVFGCVPESNSEAFDAACMGDLNADGIVDIQDLLDFFQLWGDECQLEEEGPLDDTDIVWSCGDPLEYQGYDYETVQIGEQCWFAENLRSESYENGDVISAGLSDDEWSFTESGATAIYGEGVSGCSHLSPTLEACNEALAYEEYGFLYNWFAVDDQRGVCPSGWHVPFMAEFQSLSATLGEDAYAGLALKATSGWFDNGNGTNESGFDGLPGGFRHEQAQFENAGYDGIWWMNYSVGESAKYLGVVSYSNAVFYETFSKNYGFSIRCIQDPE
jgi:uncharacterized protein (TIGR02145 family)